ncbi:dipeptide/oligopeptide/nickel ABC transporter ATP-binding protein [Amycolatopsis sp.]|uniref:ABC transporter ATP-binding protein n=1 Tax=Amycolatopsis sp. TaxID=37632 RepID=UPI002BBB249C|nr:dipeptide/oligopeptide/nickel ABC transporter ATP-binding protein [Amycolatopsis sp.]HVV11191.1 dipeptide/oligopeptide/nickel ABC transporter ATP-binding protein [Amycolatopsis sp.]
MSETHVSGGLAIEVVDLCKAFSGRRGGSAHLAVSAVSFAVEPGKTLAVVGESGAGKTTIVRCVAGLEEPTSGTIRVDGRPLKLRHGKTNPVQMVFQNPRDALDPMRTIGSSIAEPLRGMSRAGRKARVEELLTLVGISARRAGERPAQFSGGQLQRIVIARALAPSPQVILCDEPTAALDVSIQAQIINLLLDLQRKSGFAAVLVTHDLAVAKILADDVVVLRKGEVLFSGSMDQLLMPDESRDSYVNDLVQSTQDCDLAVPVAVSRTA